MLLTKLSKLTGKENMWYYNCGQKEFEERVRRWEEGEFIQDAFPSPQFNNDDREFLLTGATPSEWDHAFAEEKDV